MQGWIKEEKCLEKVGMVQRGSKESLTLFQRVSQSLVAKKNLVCKLLQEVCRGSTGCFRNFYRMFRIATRCFESGFWRMGE